MSGSPAQMDRPPAYSIDWRTCRVSISYKPPIAPTKNYCQVLFRNHFQALLFDVLPSEAFHDYLKRYFRSTVPPLRPPHLPTSRRCEFTLPNRYLYRIGILPKYASMLADVAYEQLGRVVRGDWDVLGGEPDETDRMEEDQEEGEEWKHKILKGLEAIVKQDILGWLFGYIEGKSEVWRSTGADELSEKKTIC